MTQEIETAPDRTAEAAESAARTTYRRTATALAAGKELNAKELAAMTRAMALLGYGWENLQQDVRAIEHVVALQKRWSEKTVDDLQMAREKARERAARVRAEVQEKLAQAEHEVYLADHRLRKWSELGNTIEGLQRRSPRVFPAG